MYFCYKHMRGRSGLMEEETKYFVLKQKAVPEVLLKVTIGNE